MENRKPLDKELMPRSYYYVLMIFATPLGLHRFATGHKKHAMLFLGTFGLGLGFVTFAEAFGETGKPIAGGIGFALLVVFLLLLITDLVMYPFAVGALYDRVLNSRRMKALQLSAANAPAADAAPEPLLPPLPAPESASLYEHLRSDPNRRSVS
ncbi:TM2 domain-containing protein [Leucobacter sp. cx-169]|uniref:TM2 domain-containing protein n=1 Tax=Leucobacter sp. cx-169 TaxID=2770549 RepID=UPI00165D65D9|nr:TM2 domain-containing protein [Leucobacter sp. cx-169]MBC9927286.1 TM2 domain-containing protein [Leucobacter sp. cx-169]